MAFTAFDILTAEEQNNLVENIEALAAGTGLEPRSVPPSKWTNPYCFSAYLTANQTGLVTGSFNTINCNAEFTDPNSNYNIATYTYTIPVTGVYEFNINAQTLTSSTDQAITVKVNGTTSYNVGRYPNASANGSRTLDGSITLLMTAGQTVVAQMYAVAASWVISGDTNGQNYGARWSGKLVHAT